MANDNYEIDTLVPGTATITVVDDGTGIDSLVILGTFPDINEIRLRYTFNNGASDSASGVYYDPIGTGHRLVVNGLIENARGSDGRDNIQGNEARNVLFGDRSDANGFIGGADTLYGLDGNDLIYGGFGGDDITGDGGRDVLYGNVGVDTVSGGLGIDTIYGGAGADSLSGGADNGDTLSYAGLAVGVGISLNYGLVTTGRGGEAQGDRITGFTNIVGTSGNDTLTDARAGEIAFGYNANVFTGGFGNDRLNLGGGNDRGFGGAGSDTIQGGQGNDRLVGDGASDFLYGGTERDALSGSAGSDRLFGGGGADVLTGGTGRDVMAGGGGADRFVFAARADSGAGVQRDLIADFSLGGGDRIDLRAIDADAGAAANQAFRFVGTRAFTGDAGELRVQRSGGDLILSADITGDRRADFSVLIDDVTRLTASDLFL